MIFETLGTLILKSLLAGIAAFISPCNLALIPTFISFVTTTAKNRSQSLYLSIAFALGYSLTIGIVNALVIAGLSPLRNNHWLSGIITILIAIYIFFLKDIQKFFRNLKQKRKESQKSSHTVGESTVEPEVSTSDTSNDPNLPTDVNQSQPEKIEKSLFVKMGGGFALGFSIASSALACTTSLFAAVLNSTVTDTASDYLYVYIVFGLGIFIPYLIIGVFIGEVNNRYLVKMIKFGSILDKVLAILLLWIGIEIICAGYGYDLLFTFI